MSLPPNPIPCLLADVCFLLHPLSESTSTFCSRRPLLSRLSTRTRCFAFIRPSAPLHCTFQPYPLTPLPSFATYCLSPLCVSPRNSNASSTLEYLFLTQFSKLLFYYFLRFLHSIFLAVIQHFYCFSLTPLCS